MNKRTSFNLPPASIHKLKRLRTVYTTKTEIIVLGIDRVYEDAVRSGVLSEEAEDKQREEE
jgi:hypothetical protein